jgi:hypothetical protein
MRRVAIVLALISATVACIALACGPGDLSDLTAGRPDAGAGAIEGGVAEAAACIHAGPPAPPTAADGPSLEPQVFALEGIRFFNEDNDASALPLLVGVDLDHTCTCPEPESCIPPGDAAAPKCDLSDGRDNAAGPLLSLFSTLARGSGPERTVKQIRAGLFDLLVSVQGWNGQPDDPAVIVGVQLSSGTEGVMDDAGTAPRFDGTDVWTVNPGSVLGGADIVGKDCRKAAIPCIPARVDTTAYVTGGVIVAHLDVPLPLEGSSGVLQIDFSSATFTARIEPFGASYRLTGEIAGRWPADNLLHSFARVPNPTDGRALCSTDAGLEIFGLVRQNVCMSLDLTADPAADRTGARCNALSNTLSFTATHATLGTVYETPQGPDECPGFDDTCPK